LLLYNTFQNLTIFSLCDVLLSYFFSEVQEAFLAGLEHKTVFELFSFVPVISSSKQIMLVLGAFFYRAYFRATKTFLLDSNPGLFVGVVAFDLVISLPKKTTLVLAPFFYRS
jgi:hypothetical protein